MTLIGHGQQSVKDVKSVKLNVCLAAFFLDELQFLLNLEPVTKADDIPYLNLQQGTFTWLWDSLSLKQMYLYDLHKQTTQTLFPPS